MICRDTSIRRALRAKQRGFLLNPFRFAGGGGGDPSFSSVSLLLHMNGTNGSTTFTDSSGSPKTVTAYNGAAISTAQSKFGGASGLFDGTNDYLDSAANAGFQFGTGDFTVEFWVRYTSIPAAAGLVGTYNGATTGWLIQSRGSSGNMTDLRVLKGDTVLATLAWTGVSVGVWYHIAVTRSGTNLRAFVNGTQIGSTATNSTDLSDATPLTIARLNLSGGLQYYPGYMDELRITKGVARYTANFTEPSSQFPDS